MTRRITFNQLRKIKDALPDGAMHRIAEELSLDADTIRNYFGGSNYDSGEGAGIHIEPGPDGGIVELTDTTILEKALQMIGEVVTPDEEKQEEVFKE